MTSGTNFADYFRVIAGRDNGRTIAQKTGLGEASISRWMQGKTDPHPRQVVAIARAYGHSPLDALIAAGYLNEEEVQVARQQPRPFAIRDFSDLELAQEMVRRVEEGGHGMLEEPLDADHPAMQGVSGGATNVTPLRRIEDFTVEELEALPSAASHDDSEPRED